MTKFYNKLECNFTQISNSVLLNKNISGTAFKLYSYIVYRLSSNQDWVLYEEEIKKHFQEGDKRFKTAKQELIQEGYIKQLQQTRRLDGTMGAFEYEVYSQPHILDGGAVNGYAVTGGLNNTISNKQLEVNNIKEKKDKKKENENVPSVNVFNQEELNKNKNLNDEEIKQTIFSICKEFDFTQEEVIEIQNYHLTRKREYQSKVKTNEKIIRKNCKNIFNLKQKGLNVKDIVNRTNTKDGKVYQGIEERYFENDIRKLVSYTANDEFKKLWDFYNNVFLPDYKSSYIVRDNPSEFYNSKYLIKKLPFLNDKGSSIREYLSNEKNSLKSAKDEVFKVFVYCILKVIDKKEDIYYIFNNSFSDFLNDKLNKKEKIDIIKKFKKQLYEIIYKKLDEYNISYAEKEKLYNFKDFLDKL